MTLIKQTTVNGTTAFIAHDGEHYCLLVCPDGMRGYSDPGALADDLACWHATPRAVRLAGLQWPDTLEGWEDVRTLN